MTQIKATCGYFNECEIKNEVNCRRCLKAMKPIRSLYEGQGFSGEQLENMMNSVKGMSALMTGIVNITRKNYWCNQCSRNHRLSSKIGKKHKESNLGILATPEES